MPADPGRRAARKLVRDCQYSTSPAHRRSLHIPIKGRREHSKLALRCVRGTKPIHLSVPAPHLCPAVELAACACFVTSDGLALALADRAHPFAGDAMGDKPIDH